VTDVQPAPKQLAMLAAAMRGWDYEEIRAAIIAASQAGWDDERIYRETFRLLLIEDGCPADLRLASRRPTQPPAGEPADGRSAAARARDLYPNLRPRERDPQAGAA
jgi:hypothetical protein